MRALGLVRIQKKNKDVEAGPCPREHHADPFPLCKSGQFFLYQMMRNVFKRMQK